MTTFRANSLDQSLDIAGSLNQNDSLNLTDEPNLYGAVISGQTGTAASITTMVGDELTITGLTGISTISVGRFLELDNTININNSGVFEIILYISASSVKIKNSLGIAFDGNNGFITWKERRPYSLEDDLNFIRTDRSNIKGVDYYDNVPVYQRPDNITSDVDTNLSNISGKTLDAKSVIVNLVYKRPVTVSSSSLLIIDSGNLKHSDGVNLLGIPTFDTTPDLGNHEYSYVELIDPTTNLGLNVLTGVTAGYRVYGRTISSGATSPNSITVEFRQVALNDVLSSSLPYTWETGQASFVHFYLPIRKRFDYLLEDDFRKTLTNGIISDSGLQTQLNNKLNITDHAKLREAIHLASDGPFEEFLSGAYRETLPLANPFPTSVIWYEDSLKTKKIIEKNYSYAPNKTVTSVQLKVYQADGITVLKTFTDTIVYSGVFEINRTRTII